MTVGPSVHPLVGLTIRHTLLHTSTLKVCWKVSSTASNVARRQGSIRSELIFSRVYATIHHYIGWSVRPSVAHSYVPRPWRCAGRCCQLLRNVARRQGSTRTEVTLVFRSRARNNMSLSRSVSQSVHWLVGRSIHPRVPIHFHCPNSPRLTVALLEGKR